MDRGTAKRRAVAAVRAVAATRLAEVEERKRSYHELARPDFVWHFLLQSFATMGRASGIHGLIGTPANYSRVTYSALAQLPVEERVTVVHEVCRAAKIRMPGMKARFILQCFEFVTRLGGPEATKAKLLAETGRDAKIRFLQTFPGIGPKYARNIMMDVYHEEFRDSIAIDVRIKAISELLGQTFGSYDEHEKFYLAVAADAGLNGWELDRLLFGFRPEIEAQIRQQAAEA
jgi:hypothetical protein